MRSEKLALGLIGWPLDHSLSPPLHQAALQAAGLSGEYRLYPTPDDEAGAGVLRELFARMRSGEIHGLNVTIPHKQTVIPYLDALTPTATTMGAVNTIAVEESRLLGDNTDAPGFLADLRRCFTLDRGSAIVLGAGGSARAVVSALVAAGWRVHVVARRIEQARRLVEHLSATGSRIVPAPLDSACLTEIAPGCSLIVNCTPLGMAPNVDASPWPDAVPFPARAAVYDLVYNPRETELLRAARAHGLPAASGIGMLIEQAALAFERWTGHVAQRDVMRSAIDGALNC